MNSPQQVFSHPSSSPPITTLHPSPSQHWLATSFQYPTMFVGPTGKRPMLFLSHRPLTTPTGGQQPCGAHGECFPHLFWHWLTDSAALWPITSSDMASIHPSTSLPHPCHHQCPACHHAQQTPQSPSKLISQTVAPISIHAQRPPQTPQSHLFNSANCRCATSLKSHFANSAPHIDSHSTPTPNLLSPPISQTVPIAGVPPPSSLCTNAHLLLNPTRFTCPPYWFTLNALAPTPTHLFTAPCALSHPFAHSFLTCFAISAVHCISCALRTLSNQLVSLNFLST